MLTPGLLAYLIAVSAAVSEDMALYPQAAQYVHLVSKTQEIFASSTVFIINAGNYENLPDTLLSTVLLREFSEKGVLSQTMNFTKLSAKVRYYNARTMQPLFVVILRTRDDALQFAESTRLYDMAQHTWLLIFMRSADEAFNAMCRSPRANLFNLVISTKMLVLCAGEQVLKEWYSIDGHRVDVGDYAVWRYPQGIEMIASETFYERRSDFKGTTLRVAGVKDTRRIAGWNSTMEGFFGKVLYELSSMMNFTVRVVSLEDSYGAWNESTKRWNGVIGRLVEGKIDVGVGEFTLSKQRNKFIDFSIPLMLTTSDLYIKRPTAATVEWSCYIRAFHIDVWILIVVTITVSPIFLALMWKVIRCSDSSHYLMAEYLHVWGIYCQKPLPDFPTATSLRLAYLTIFTSSLVLFAVYSAYLTSYLTIFSPSLPFTDYDGFVADGTYRLIIIKNSHGQHLFKKPAKDEKMDIYAKMGMHMKPNNQLPLDVYDAIEQVCNENVVFYTNQLFIGKASRYSPCALMPLTQGILENVGFALVENSPYRELIDYNLKKLRALGIIECLKRRYFRKFTFQDSTYLPVSFAEIIPVVVVLSLGFALSLALLICEKVVHDKSRSTKKIGIPASRCDSHTFESAMLELEEKIGGFRYREQGLVRYKTAA